MDDSVKLRRAAKARAKTVFFSNFAKCAGISAILFAVSFLGSTVSGSLNLESQTFTDTVTFDDIINNLDAFYIGTSVSFLISLICCPLRLGMYMVYSRLAKGEKASVSDIFLWFGDIKLLGKAFGATLWHTLLTLGWYAAYTAAPTAIIFGLLFIPESIMSAVSRVILLMVFLIVLLVTSVIAAVRAGAYEPAFVLIAENPDRGIRETFRGVSRMMKGRRWSYFVFKLSFLGWEMLGALACGFGVIFVTPYVDLSVVAYTGHVALQYGKEEENA